MKVCCVFSLESPHRGDSNENTQYTIFNMNKKNTLNYPKSAAMGFFQETQERVRNSRGKRAISVRAIEVLLYVVKCRTEGICYGYYSNTSLHFVPAGIPHVVLRSIYIKDVKITEQGK